MTKAPRGLRFILVSVVASLGAVEMISCSSASGAVASNVSCDITTIDTCTCGVVESGKGNDSKCSPSENAGGGACCASQGWPTTGECSCGPFRCNDILDRCDCAVGLWSTGTPSCTGAYCCVDSIGGCHCAPKHGGEAGTIV